MISPLLMMSKRGRDIFENSLGCNILFCVFCFVWTCVYVFFMLCMNMSYLWHELLFYGIYLMDMCMVD